jgi:hypothetical protein
MQIVGKLKKPKSRKPLILLDLRLVIQLVLPLGPIGAILAGSSPVTRTNNLGRYTKVVFYLYFD